MLVNALSCNGATYIFFQVFRDIDDLVFDDFVDFFFYFLEVADDISKSRGGQQAITRTNVDPDICRHMVSSATMNNLKRQIIHRDTLRKKG